jgi:hypothetical protein
MYKSATRRYAVYAMSRTIRFIPAAVKIYICYPGHRLAKARTGTSH